MKERAEGIMVKYGNSLWKNKEAQERLDIPHEERIENQSDGSSLIKRKLPAKILPK
jgi:hypothetical protein